MKLLLISDLHICTDVMKLKEILKENDYDCVLLLGDNAEYDMNIINENAKDVPILSVLGENNSYRDYDNIKNNKIIDIHASLYKLNEFTVVGIDGSNKYKISNNPMHYQEEILDLVETLPKADILISHTGPANIITSLNDDDISSHGFKGINKFISLKKPKYHFFGHYHKYSDHYFWSGTKSYCIYGVALFDTTSDRLDILFDDSQDDDQD